MARLANLQGRAVVVIDGEGFDVARRSGGRFESDPQSLYERWDELLEWAGGLSAPEGADHPELPAGELLAPAPRPRQVFGIGLNYRDHCEETGMPIPSRVATFTKFPTCIVGGFEPVELPADTVDYEVELVVVMGRRAVHVAAEDAWEHVAGLTVGQDLSERVLQREAGGQFCLAKSYPGFGPMGPWLVTPDELADPDDLALGCSLNGEVMQDGRTSNMVYGVPRLIEELSGVVPLLPGDVIFTGTPAGVGWVRQPPRFLRPGDVLESTIEGIGSIRTTLR